ncbi:HTH domain-containing protein [Clavibacter sp. Sh2141]|uniref:HTH domain-containing protein n=1 Tax=Clavibacter sp. Sh2141 TaxID=3395374 RepID=UPI0039BD87A2
MSADSLDTMRELRRVVAEGRITIGSLSAATGISSTLLLRLTSESVDDGSGVTAHAGLLTSEETVRVSGLVARLTAGSGVDDDIRLRSILETLTCALELTPTNIAGLTGIDVAAVDAALHDPRDVAMETRYALAVRASYLLHAMDDAAPSP